MRITEILFREGLKKGVEAFLAGGKAEGFSTEQMFTALLKIIGKDSEYNAALLNKVLDNLRHAENEDLSSQEMDETEYFSMMKKVLNKKYGRKIPSQRCLIIAFDILYTIHEKEYVGTVKLTQNEAKQKAFSHANVSSSNAYDVEVELDHQYYEVSFKSGQYEYEYKINASDGSIVAHEKDYDD